MATLAAALLFLAGPAHTGTEIAPPQQLPRDELNPACAGGSAGKAKGTTMRATIILFLQCLTCGQKLRLAPAAERSGGEISAGTLVCAAGHAWPIEGGVLAFTRDDAPSDPWSATCAGYDGYRQDQQETIAPSRVAVAPLVSAVKQAPPDLLVDVCTGAGGCSSTSWTASRGRARSWRWT